MLIRPQILIVIAPDAALSTMHRLDAAAKISFLTLAFVLVISLSSTAALARPVDHHAAQAPPQVGSPGAGAPDLPGLWGGWKGW